MPRLTRREQIASHELYGMPHKEAVARAGGEPVVRAKRPTGRKGPEQIVLNAILGFLRERGIPADRINTMAIPVKRYNKRTGRTDVTFRPPPSTGITDIIGTLPPHGRALYIEVKRPGAPAHPARERNQRAYQQKHRAAGALVLVARSVDDVIAGLP